MLVQQSSRKFAIFFILLVVVGLGAAGLTNPAHAVTHYSPIQKSVVVDSRTAARAQVSVRHGWYPLAGTNINAATFNISNILMADKNRGAYGVAVGAYYESFYAPMPGGRNILSARWRQAGARETTRTKSSSVRSLSASMNWSPRQHYSIRTIVRVCVDLKWSPDKCGSDSAFIKKS